MKRIAALFVLLAVASCVSSQHGPAPDASTDGGPAAIASVPPAQVEARKFGATEPPLWGRTTMALSKSVTIASDQAALPITGTISVDTSALATAAKQDTGNTSLGTIATNTTGVSTAANQTTANSSLSSIATNTGNIPAKGTSTMTGSTPVTIATNDTVSAALQVALNLLTQPKSTTTVTPSDSTDTTSFCGKGIWVGVAGNVAVKMLSDSSATTLVNVPSGTFLPGQFLRIMSTNTTATTIICFGGTG